MADIRIIAVVGATGAQGSGLVRAIQSDPGGGFRARALTRNVNSERARELAKLGAEVVAANIDEPQSLAHAFSGAYGAFCVTFYWDHLSPERELAEARAMVGAAKQADLRHVIWSTLEDTRQWVPLSDNRMPTLMEKYKVPHFDAKGEANRYFTEAGLPVTLLNTSFFWENFLSLGMAPQRGADGTLVLSLPMGDKKLPGIAVDDIGRCAYAIFKRGSEFIGRTIGIAGEHLTGEQMAASFSKALGQKVRYNDVPLDVYRGLGFPGAEDLGNMFQFKRDFEEYYCGARDLSVARNLNPQLQTFDRWLEKNKSRIPLQAGAGG